MNKIGREFMEKTKYQYLDKSDQLKGIPQPPPELAYDTNQKLIELPNPQKYKGKTDSLCEVIAKRRSLRQYSRKPLSVEELSYLLWCTQGVQEVTSDNKTLRTVPSAGARHAFETYLLINNVESIDPGLYRFLAVEHKLQQISISPDLSDKFVDGALGQQMVKNCAVTFIWVAVVSRMTWRYGERGYRYMLLDAGHVCQNLYLSGESVNCGTCAIAAYSDDDMNNLLSLDGVNQFVIYMATTGRK